MKQILRKNNNINIWPFIFIILKKRRGKEEKRDKMLHLIIRLTFLVASVLGISSFFGTLLDSYIIAIIAGIVVFFVMITTAYKYNKIRGKPIVKL